MWSYDLYTWMAPGNSLGGIAFDLARNQRFPLSRPIVDNSGFAWYNPPIVWILTLLKTRRMPKKRKK